MSVTLYMHKQFCRAVHRLTDVEQAAVKAAIVSYIDNPKLPGLHWHRLDKCKDQAFASIRSSLDIRIILHPCLDGEIVCYADHHDAAYDWAEKRSLKFDTSTGEVLLYQWPVPDKCLFAKPKADKKPPLFRNVSDGDLRWYGVPDEWLAAVRQITEADQVLELAGSLPESACEALLALAEGKRPRVVKTSKREVFKIENTQQIGSVLDMSWDEWSVYLHPSQEAIVADATPGDLLVTGGPGTGKTVVALHRAARISRVLQDGKVLLATVSNALASRLGQQIKILDADCGRCRIMTLREVAKTFMSEDELAIIARADYDELIRQIANDVFVDDVYGVDELRDEYAEFWDERRLGSTDYLSVNRSHCAFALNKQQRTVMYRFMQSLSGALHELALCTEYSYFLRAAEAVSTNDYSEIIVDECQNLSRAEWRFVKALQAKSRLHPRLCLFGDANQRVVGASFPEIVHHLELSVNYRSSELVDRRASRMLGLSCFASLSLYRGLAPILHQSPTKEKECEYVRQTLRDIRAANPSLRLSEIAFFVHDGGCMSRAEDILETCGVSYVCFCDEAEFGSQELEAVTVATFNQAPGLEYRVVFIVGCEEGIVPPRDIENTDYERRLLYVVMTRARDVLVMTGVCILSEFLTQTRQTVAPRQVALTDYLANIKTVPHKPREKAEALPVLPHAALHDAGNWTQEIKHELAGPSNSEIAAEYMTALYHMASLDNIASLLRLGLLSKNLVAERGLSFCDISDGSVQSRRKSKCDSRYGRHLHDYASLYINPRNAMLYRVQEIERRQIYILEIDLSVLDETSFVFTNANAACATSRFYADLHDLKKLNWSVIKAASWSNPDANMKRVLMQQMQAEFLIHPSVLPKFVKAVLCRGSESQNRLLQIVHGVPVRCEPKLFF